jgi:hypothetical protein
MSRPLPRLAALYRQAVSRNRSGSLVEYPDMPTAAALHSPDHFRGRGTDRDRPVEPVGERTGDVPRAILNVDIRYG